jgi:SAM-dependent methyltransferase
VDRLAGARELIDDESDPIQLADTLRELARINRLLGGANLSWRALRAAVGAIDGRQWTLLDVGTGGADIPRRMLVEAARAGLRLAITATDVNADIVATARAWSAGSGVIVEQMPADALPYADRSFDVVHASLVLHHLEPAEATALLAEMGRVARHAVIVNDLVRARRWWLGARLLTLLTRNRCTRHDAPVSVRRAYLPAELAELAAGAGLRPAELLHDRLGHRFALVLRQP